MSDDMLVEMALQRQEAFNNLPKYLGIIKNVACRLDPKAKTYLFGSARTVEHNYSSDIDILLITRVSPARVYSEMWKAGITEPFEIHVYSSQKADFFKLKANIIEF